MEFASRSSRRFGLGYHKLMVTINLGLLNLFGYDFAVADAIGLRERKKQQTRQQIYEAARKLFETRGFDRVSVAEIARAADVSEVTVFNYFPTKEDLFYGGMEFFEEELIESVRSRPKGDSAVKAFRRRLLVGADRLESKPSAEAILKAAQLVS